MADITGMLQAAAGVGGEPTPETDPNFNQTVLLLHGDGSNGAQNNTFLDSSSNGFSITRNGNTTQGTFSPFSAPDGRWSNYFAGGGSRLTTGTISLASDFCIEGWIYVTSASEPNPMIVGGSGTTGSANHQFRVIASSGAIGLVIAGTQVISDSGTAVTLDAWHHVVACRSGTDCAVFVDGVRQGTGTSSGTFAAAWIGDRNAADYSFVGYMSNIRIVNGASVYDPTSSSLTVPTGPLSDITDTDLLTCSLNRFVDASAAGTTVTPTGTIKVTPFSPFAHTAAYDASVNGGSGYFDGSGDYLTTPDNAAFDFGTGSFTIECWYYKMANANQSLVDTRSLSTNGYLIWPESDGTVSLDIGNSSRVLNGAIAFPLNAWTHLVFVKDGSNNLASFVNGVRDDLDTATTTLNAATSFTIGAKSLGTSSVVPITGYLSSLRVVKGSAEYDPTSTTLTVPSAPPTSDANTSLLLNFTNAGIFDNTGKNNLETVGNAQIDTTVKKYGTGSMEFDGTGDWLKVPNSPDLQLGTGDFTIEFWVYLASGDTGSARGLVAKGGASTGWLVSLDSSEKVVFTYTTSTITSSGAITTNAWNHIAVVREGTGSNETKIYIGGTNDGTGTVSTDFNQTEVMYIGANRAAGDPMKGFIDDLRITKGVARYTTTFTPPTKAFPDL